MTHFLSLHQASSMLTKEPEEKDNLHSHRPERPTPPSGQWATATCSNSPGSQWWARWARNQESQPAVWWTTHLHKDLSSTHLPSLESTTTSSRSRFSQRTSQEARLRSRLRKCRTRVTSSTTSTSTWKSSASNKWWKTTWKWMAQMTDTDLCSRSLLEAVGTTLSSFRTRSSHSRWRTVRMPSYQWTIPKSHLTTQEDQESTRTTEWVNRWTIQEAQVAVAATDTTRTAAAVGAEACSLVTPDQEAWTPRDQGA